MTSSDELFAAAQRLMPGGVNSPVRAFRGVGGTPFFVAHAQGARLTDVDGRRYFRWKRSTRPAVSRNFCFPVKKGWHLEQTSTRIDGTVERVWMTSPQLQVIVVST